MPNIAIYEGGKAARMNGVSRITTDDGNGGKIVWVPQSDRQTGTLYVSENGTYRAEDEGLHSWSKVTVRLAGAPLGLEIPTLPDPVTGAEIPTGEEGELEPVAPAGLEPIDEDTEIVNADDIDPEDPDAIEELADELGVSPEDIIVVDPEDPSTVKEAEPKPNGEGQKITGKNPETGDTETIGIKPDGTVDKEEAIAEIRLYTDPSKLMYHDGESIDFTGMEFAAYGASGRVLKVFPWPDSKIETPVTKADMDEATDIEVRYNDITIGMTSQAIAEASGFRRDIFYFYPQGVAVWDYGMGGFTQLYATPKKSSITARVLTMSYHYEHGEKVYDSSEWSYPQFETSSMYTYAGKTVFYTSNMSGWSPSAKVTNNGYIPDDAKALGMGMVAWIMVYGDYKRGVQKVPVSYDGHEDYFEIWVS